MLPRWDTGCFSLFKLILLISGNICLHHSDCGGREGQGIPHGQVDLQCGTEVKKLVECRHVITALFSFATKFDKAVVQSTGHHGVMVPDGGSHQGSEVWAGNQGGQVASLPEVCRQRWRPGVCREALRSPQAGQSQVRVFSHSKFLSKLTSITVSISSTQIPFADSRMWRNDAQGMGKTGLWKRGES